MEIISVRENPEMREEITAYIKSVWGRENTMALYEDCIRHSVGTDSPLPHWYILKDGGRPVGSAGLVTNDFISRMDLFPWICALYIAEDYRGKAYGSLLIDRAKADARAGGFRYVYLSTDHIGYYEKYGFSYIGDGYHPWGETSRIYRCEL